MFLVNSRLGRFSAAHFTEHSFSRSYGVILQSSLAIVLSLTLGFSPHPCVSIFGTGRKLASAPSVLAVAFRSHHVFALRMVDLPAIRLPRLHPLFRPWAHLALSVTPSQLLKYRNLCLLSIGYAFRPRLRSRLTQSGRTFLWKPWVFGAWDSHPRSATSMLSTPPSGDASSYMERSPTIPWDP